MTQTTAKTSDNRHGEINQAAGHPCAAHDLCGQDEQRHRHKGKNVQLGKNALRQDRQKLGFVDGDERQH